MSAPSDSDPDAGATAPPADPPRPALPPADPPRPALPPADPPRPAPRQPIPLLADRPPPSGPPPLAKPPRSAMTVRDMLVALAVLVPLILLVGGLSRACSFSPAGPTVDPGRLPIVDAPAELRELAASVPFGLRIPAVPPGWRSNSVDQDPVGNGAGRAVRTGYLTPEGRYLRLLQSDVAEEALLAVETGANPVPARGTVDVGGQRWVVYGTGTGEPIWIAQVSTPIAPVRMLITGSGGEADYRTLAGAAATGELLTPP